MEGWIKLYRKLSEWEWFNISEMVHLFIYLLLNANHEKGEWRGIIVERGQIITGRNTLTEKTGITQQTIRTCLNRLKSTNEITITSTNKYSIITICNYESYQGCVNGSNQQINQLPNQQLTSNQPATNQQLTTNNNNKNEKKLKKYYNIPPSFEEIELRYKERGLKNFVPATFFAHYETNGWMVGKNKMKNWDAALTYWENNNKITNNANNRGNNTRSIKRINDHWN